MSEEQLTEENFDRLLKPKIPLWKHQKEAVLQAYRQTEFGLFFEVGAGKSATAITILRYKYMAHKRLLRTLILAPPIVLENWKREFLMHSNIKPKDISILYGTRKERVKHFIRNGIDEIGESRPHIFITNYESISLSSMEELYDLIANWEPEAIVFDELHKLKETKTRRTKKAIALATTARFRYGLTGTPVLNSPMDLFSQFKCLDLGRTFGTNFFIFRAQYFYDKNAGMPSQKHFPDWRIKPGAIEDISNKIKAITMHVKKEECLDLPPLVRKVYTIELNPEQRKHYNAMKKSFITFVNDKACVASMALTKALRLQQIASGFMKLEDGTEISTKKNPRQELLKELLEEIAPHHKVLVWACFKENYEQIKEVCNELSLRYVEVHGEVSGESRFKAVDDFNQDKEIRVLIGHPGSGGIGINLIAASYSIFYSRSFSLEHDIQAEGRNYRGGSNIHTKITRIDIVAKDTIDEIVQSSLANKEDISKRILSEYKGFEASGNVSNTDGRSFSQTFFG